MKRSALDASSGTATTALSSDASGDGVTGDGLGQTFLWIGGTVTPSTTRQRGSYTASPSARHTRTKVLCGVRSVGCGVRKGREALAGFFSFHTSHLTLHTS
jgi:hypothetical protein